MEIYQQEIINVDTNAMYLCKFCQINLVYKLQILKVEKIRRRGEN